MKRFIFFSLLFIVSSVQAVPTLIDFNVNLDATYTTSENVALYIYSTDSNKMNFSCDNNEYGNWVDYSNTSNFDMKTGAGCTGIDANTTVYIKLWNVDENTFFTGNDTIIIDTNAPIAHWVYIDANEYNVFSALNADKNLLVRVKSEINLETKKFSIGDINEIDLFDDGAHNDSGVNDGIWAGSLDIKTTNKNSTGYLFADVNLVDSAGNITVAKSFTTVVIDLNKPTSSGQVPLTYSNDRTPTIKINILDPLAGIDINSTVLTVNTIDYNFEQLTFTAIDNGYEVAYTPDANLSGSTIDINFFYSDKADNNNDTNWSVSYDFNGPNPVTDINATAIASTNDINIAWQGVSDQLSGVIKYLLYRQGSVITIADINSATLVSDTIPAVVGLHQYTEDLNSSLEDENIYYAVRAVDAAGNLSDIVTNANVKVNDISAPTDVNFGFERDVNTIRPKFTYVGSDVSEVYLSCDGVDYNGPFTETPLYGFNVTDENYGCETADGNRTIYMKFVDNSDNNNTVSYGLLLDRTAPGQPSGLTSELRSDGVYLTWSAVSDSMSGLESYRVYISSTSDINHGTHFEKVTGAIQYLDVTPANVNYYSITAIDKAGNESLFSTVVKEGLDKNIPEIIVKFPQSIYRGDEKYINEFNLRIELTSDKELVFAKGIITIDENTTQDINLDKNGEMYVWIGDLNTSEEKNLTFDFNIQDVFDISATKSEELIIDITPPAINAFDLNQLNEERIIVTGEFSSDTNYFILEYDDGNGYKEIIKGEDIPSNFPEFVFVVDWNVVEITSGLLDVRFKVYDFLGNELKVNKELRIEGKTVDVEVELEDLKVIESNIKNKILDMIFYAFDLDEEAKYYYDGFLESIKSANELTDKGDRSAARDEIEKAKISARLFELIIPKFTIEKEVSHSLDRNTEFIKGRINELMQGDGWDSAIRMADNVSIFRRGHIVKVEVGGTTSYYPVIRNRIKNTSNLLIKDTFLIVDIPKQFANQISEITSNTVFTVIEDDPLVAFFIPEIAVNGEITVIQRTRRSMSLQEAQDIINREFIEGMEIPVLVEKEEHLRDYKRVGLGILELLGISFIVLILVGILLFVRKLRGSKDASDI